MVCAGPVASASANEYNVHVPPDAHTAQHVNQEQTAAAAEAAARHCRSLLAASTV